MSTVLPDGLDALRVEMDLNQIMRLIERTARWVDPATFRLLPLWYPEHARKTLLYKGNWSSPLLNKGDPKEEGNTSANKALTLALGLRSRDRTNWSCCHIWGVDDPLFQSPNLVIQDRRFFSCVANMVLLPTPLKAFTDAMPEVKAMLRVCAQGLYGWCCTHESVTDAADLISRWNDWDAYPDSWPRQPGDNKQPLGIMPLTDRVRRDAARRLARIKHDLVNAGQGYPREQVQSAMAYWGIKLQ